MSLLIIAADNSKMNVLIPSGNNTEKALVIAILISHTPFNFKRNARGGIK
jgi:hypothetical protein